jgi:hypothetical protein
LSSGPLGKRSARCGGLPGPRSSRENGPRSVGRLRGGGAARSSGRRAGDEPHKVCCIAGPLGGGHDEHTREIIAAQDAWRYAKRAYDDEATQFVGVARLPSVARPGPVDGLTREACERLTQLGEAERAAAAAFCAVLDDN